MYPKLLSTLVLALAVSACATNPPVAAPVAAAPDATAAAVATTAKPDSDDGLICRMETTIGSNRMKRVCRAKVDVEKEARQTQDLMRRMQRSGAREGN